jgi:hypothetical protein
MVVKMIVHFLDTNETIELDNTEESMVKAMFRPKNKNTDLNKLISRLRYFNEWRRGADCQQPDPTEIGNDIDMAIQLLSKLEK